MINKNLIIPCSCFIIFWIFFEFFSIITRILFNIIYPLYSSIKCLENSKLKNQNNNKWLIYWIVYLSFNLLEFICDRILYWIPFYYPLKFFFAISLIIEKKICYLIYFKIIKPLFLDPTIILLTINQLQRMIKSEKIYKYIKEKISEHPVVDNTLNIYLPYAIKYLDNVNKN
jgi:receptor expression-enhancing protein 5/6